jgi:chromate transport protein ChrA
MPEAPSAVLMIAIANGFQAINTQSGFLHGLKLAAVAIVAAERNLHGDWFAWLLVLLSGVAVFFFSRSSQTDVRDDRHCLADQRS